MEWMARPTTRTPAPQRLHPLEPLPGLPDLADAVVSLRTRDEAQRFLRDLCTLPELEALSHRWQTALLLEQGLPYLEIAERVAESFAVKVRRPDKEDNIRIEPLAHASPSQAPSKKQSHSPWRDAGDTDHTIRRNDNSRDATGPKQRGKPHGENGSKFAFGKKKKHRNNSGHAGRPQPASASSAKAAPGKKTRNNRRD